MGTKALFCSILIAAAVALPSDIFSLQSSPATITKAEWTWVSGSNTINHAGIYGTLGVASPTNMPGSRQQAVSWTDAKGNFWVFGGYGEDVFASDGWLNDLWKFDGTNWTWMGGSNNVNNWGVYGTRGIANPSNMPGGRAQAVSWQDGHGNVWLFGGNGQGQQYYRGYLNDLWKFDGTNWTWVSGTGAIEQQGMYASKGMADPANVPSGRQDASSWVDDSGHFWLFGGFGYDSTFAQGSLNDLWKFDGALWTWMSGSPTINQRGVYGTQGTGAPGNLPGARYGASTWMEKGGALWLFGGNGDDSTGSQGVLNDLWTWNGTLWTWVNGSNVINQGGNYGTLGVASPTNVPGARQDASLFLTSSGDLCLFGGQGEDSATHLGQQNDFWRYRPPTNPNAKPLAPKGVAAVAGKGANQLSWSASVGAASYTLSRGTASGGETLLKEGIGSLVYVDRGLTNGTKYYYKVAASGPTGVSPDSAEVSATPLATLPGSPVLTAAAGVSKVVLTWTHTGTTYQVSRSLSTGGPYSPLGAPTTKGTLTDTGLVNGTTYYYVVVATNGVGNSVLCAEVAATPSGPLPAGSWTWISGAATATQAGSYGTLGVASPANVPGSRSGSANWTDFSGHFWIFGGGGVDGNGTNGSLNDLWKFDGTNWTWVSGSNVGSMSGVYGTQGVASPTNLPGARSRPASWIDHSGNLWLFGGYGLDSSYIAGELNDLWKFDGVNWTWVKGSNVINPAGVYGTKGVANPANTPGGRDAAAYAVDPAGVFWLFGGESQSGSAPWSDLWKFDGTNWTWVSGPNSSQQVGTYGTKGVGAAGNVPGARSQGVGWNDGSGNFWLFGGYGEVGPSQQGLFNDLWKFNGTNWVWMAGPQGINAPRGIYGTQGVANPANTPGTRFGSTGWVDSSNNLWIFGGGGNDFGPAAGSLNDLWKFDGANWTWVAGADTDWEIGTYGTKGTPAAGNGPGARNYSMSFTDVAGRLWLFGGSGYDGSGNLGTLNDLWRWGP